MGSRRGLQSCARGALAAQSAVGRSRADLLARYSEEQYPALYDSPATLARQLFVYGLAGHRHALEKLWTNAEEFVDYLDTAAEPRGPGQANPHAERLKRVVDLIWSQGEGTQLDQIRASARRLIAAECCAFLEGVDPKREQWRPFRTWAGSITSNDTIVTGAISVETSAGGLGAGIRDSS